MKTFEYLEVDVIQKNLNFSITDTLNEWGKQGYQLKTIHSNPFFNELAQKSFMKHTLIFEKTNDNIFKTNELKDNEFTKP